MGSSSKGATTSTSAPPPEVMAQYENVMAQANQVAQTPYTPYTGQLVEGFNPTQEAAFGAVDQTQGLAQPYFNAATNYATLGAAPITAQGISNYFNPYTQSVTAATLGNLDLLNKQQQANLESGVEGSGGLFNDRFGVAQAQLAGQQATTEAPTIANIQQQGWTQALGAAQAQQGQYANAAYSLGSLGQANLNAALQAIQAQMGVGGLEQQLGQTGLSTAYQQWQQQQAYPFQDVSWLSSLSTGLGSNMGGTSTTTPPASSQYAPYAGLGLAALSFMKRGGGVDRPHYDFGGPVPTTPYGNVAGAYIPTGLSITHGSGPPKPPGTSSTNPLDKTAQDAIKLAGSWNAKQNASSTFGGVNYGDADMAAAAQAGVESGLSFDPISGDVMARGGGIHRRAEGGANFNDRFDPVSHSYGLIDRLDPNLQGEIEDRRGETGRQKGIHTLVGEVAKLFAKPRQEIRLPDKVQGLAADAGYNDFKTGGSVRRPHFDGGGPIVPDLGDDDDSTPPVLLSPPKSDDDSARIQQTGIDTPTPVAPSSAPWGAGSPDAPTLGDMTSVPVSGAGVGATAFTKPDWAGALHLANVTPDRAWPDTTPDLAPREPTAQQGAPVYTGGNPREHLSYGAGVVSMERAKNAIGTFESGNNYSEVGVPTKLGRALGRYQVMEAELPGQLRQAGLPPMTPQEFLRDRKAQDRLFETVFGGLQNKYGSFNDAASMWFSGRPVASAGDRKDALGTTVPMYLANTNAILAKDLGDKVAGGISFPVVDRAGGIHSAHVVSRNADDVPAEEGHKHMFSPEVRSALLKAGFALMANRSPYLAQAIGDAGLVGVASYQEAKRYEGQQAMQERKMALSEKQLGLGVRRLDQAMAASNERINLATKREANTELYRQAQMDRMTRAAEAGRIPPGYRTTGEGNLEAIPGGPADPKVISSTATAKKPPVGGMSPELQEVNARQLVAGNLSPLVGLPRTPEGLQIRNALRQQAVGILMNEKGMSVEQAANALNNAEQEFKSRQIGINSQARTAGVREENLNLILKATAGAVPAALEASDNVTRYGGSIVPLNRLIQHGEVMASDPAQVQFGMANLQLAEHWARAMNPTGVMRESDRDMALKFLDTNLSKGTYKAAVLQLQKQITRERDAIRGVSPSTPIDVDRPTPAPGAGVKSEDVGEKTPRERTKKDEAAENWARAHPGDPRAARILEHLGAP